MIVAKEVKCLPIEQIQQIISYLQLMAIGVNIDRNHGICENLHLFCIEHDIPLNGFAFVRIVSPLWPKFSRNTVFPVPFQKWVAVYAYCCIPLWEGEYGKNRKELCMFLANQLQDFIKVDCAP